VGKKNPEVIYREGEDILVFRFGEPTASVTVELGEGMLARFDPDTDELVGIEVLNYRERAAENESRSASTPPKPTANGSRRFLPKGLVTA
jgi:hypothetical protein